MSRAAALLLLITMGPAVADEVPLFDAWQNNDRCGLARLDSPGRVVLAGIERSTALSTVALGTEEAEVSVALVVIEPGSEPLHLVLTSWEAMIWVISGAVERVATVLTNASDSSDGIPRVGIIGIGAEKVHIPPTTDCFPVFWPGYAHLMRAAVDMIERLIGRRADQVVAKSVFSTVHLPSARVDVRSPLPSAIELPVLSRGRPTWQEFAWRRPAGLIRIDPKQIVSRLTAKPYDVLPGDAGLAQLLDEGALDVVESIEVTYGGLNGGNLTVQAPLQLRINRKTRLPGGLRGHHLLGPNVPLPDGDLSRVCLISEMTGESFGGGC